MGSKHHGRLRGSASKYLRARFSGPLRSSRQLYFLLWHSTNHWLSSGINPGIFSPTPVVPLGTNKYPQTLKGTGHPRLIIGIAMRCSFHRTIHSPPRRSRMDRYSAARLGVIVVGLI